MRTQVLEYQLDVVGRGGVVVPAFLLSGQRVRQVDVHCVPVMVACDLRHGGVSIVHYHVRRLTCALY